MCAGVFELEISVEAPLGATTTDSSSKGLIASGSWAGELESVCGVAVCQPTSAHQESWAALTAGSVFGPEGGTRSTGEFSVASGVSGADSPLSTAGRSLDGACEVSGSDWVSLACTDAMARSRGTLGRPRKGILSEKRLADGLKEDRF
jgi:hypothetical protein